MSKFSFLSELSQTPRFVVYNKLNSSVKEPQNMTKGLNISKQIYNAKIECYCQCLISVTAAQIFLYILILLYLHHLTIIPQQVSK